MTSKIMVVGASTMGYGIAQTCAIAGYQVILNSRHQSTIDSGMKNIARDFNDMVVRGGISRQEADDAITRITSSINLEDGADASVVIETVIEDMDVKKNVLSRLNKLCAAETIFASDTSTLSISELGNASGRPDKMIGMHFFTPVPVQRLVEVVKSVDTSEETLNVIRAMAEKLGKAVVIAPDRPGFIVNRIGAHVWNEALNLVTEGVDPQDIDTAMKLGTNTEYGPIELIDMCGADTMLRVINMLYNGYKDAKFRPNPLLVKMVEAGNLGRKTNRGFYTYEEVDE